MSYYREIKNHLDAYEGIHKLTPFNYKIPPTKSIGYEIDFMGRDYEDHGQRTTYLVYNICLYVLASDPHSYVQSRVESVETEIADHLRELHLVIKNSYVQKFMIEDLSYNRTDPTDGTSTRTSNVRTRSTGKKTPFVMIVIQAKGVAR